MNRRFNEASFLGAVISLGVASIAGAQKALPDEPGFQPNRDYLALQPWESIDTGSNNIILTLTDFVLVGNAGRELHFDRVFSNQGPAPGETPVGPQWRFGIAGVPMRVVEQPMPTEPLPTGLEALDAERNTTPYFPMLDGSSLKTTYTSPPIYNNPATLNVVRTWNFWVYDRYARILRMPDGVFAEYYQDGIPETCPAGYLIGLWDAFGNEVTLTWSTNTLDVEQSLGNGDSRMVHLVLDAGTGLPRSLAYNGKTWTYEYSRESSQISTRFERRSHEELSQLKHAQSDD